MDSRRPRTIPPRMRAAVRADRPDSRRARRPPHQSENDTCGRDDARHPCTSRGRPRRSRPSCQTRRKPSAVAIRKDLADARLELRRDRLLAELPGKRLQALFELDARKAASAAFEMLLHFAVRFAVQLGVKILQEPLERFFAVDHTNISHALLSLSRQSGSDPRRARASTAPSAASN